MRCLIPLTGTLLSGGSGDPNDPIRIIPLDLGDVSWRAVSFDWENGVVEVELEPTPRYVRRMDPLTGNPVSDETETEYDLRRTRALNHVKQLLSKSKDELYTLSKSPRLKNPFKEKK